MKILELDNEQRAIASPLWHRFCYKAVHGDNGKDGYSSTTWANIRRSAGIPSGDCKRKLTAREALVIFVRCNLDSICKQLGYAKPSGKDMEQWTLTCPLARIVNAYLATLNVQTLGQKLEEAIAISEMTGADIVQFIQVFQGGVGQIPLGERRIKDIISQSGLGRLKKNENYSYSQSKRMIQAVIDR